MRCEDVDRILSDYSVGLLSGRTDSLVRQHLDECPECALELEKLELVMAAVAEEMVEIEPPPGLWHGVANRIVPGKPPVSWTDRLTELFVGPRRVVACGAAVAVLAGVVVFGISPRTQQASMPAPEPAAIGYVQDHASAAADGAFADRVSMGFVASMSRDDGGRRL